MSGRSVLELCVLVAGWTLIAVAALALFLHEHTVGPLASLGAVAFLMAYWVLRYLDHLDGNP